MNQGFNMDDICKFDEQNICLRHKVKHEGRFYKLSQDETSVGFEFRKKWDKGMVIPEPSPAVEKKGCGCGKPKGKLK